MTLITIQVLLLVACFTILVLLLRLRIVLDTVELERRCHEADVAVWKSMMSDRMRLVEQLEAACEDHRNAARRYRTAILSHNLSAEPEDRINLGPLDRGPILTFSTMLDSYNKVVEADNIILPSETND